MATKSRKSTAGSKTRTGAKAGGSAQTSSAIRAKASGSTSPLKVQPTETKANAAIDAAIAPVVSKPVAVTKPAEKSVMTEVTPADGVSVNKKEMIVRVAKRLGMRPNQVRDITEATLAELGASLSAGEELKLPSLGKMQVKRKKDLGDAEILICKLRRKKIEKSSADPLAPAAD